MKRLIDRFGENGLQKFLFDEEIELIKNHKTAAGFWAVKEAFSKALGTGIGKKCSFKDIKIAKTSEGAPKLMLSKSIVKNFDILNTSVSITHDGDYAIAVVVIESKKSSTTDKIEQF